MVDTSSFSEKGSSKLVYTPEQIVEILKQNNIELQGKFANHILKLNARINKPLNFDVGYCTGVFIVYPYYRQLCSNPSLTLAFNGDLPLEEALQTAKVQGIAVLSSIYNKAMNEAEGASEQLAGIVAGVMDYDIKNAPYGFLKPKSNNISDNCGTGGDTINTFHISTSAGFVAAAAGVKVAKHGSPGNARRSGSSDFITYLGIDTESKSTPQKIEEAIDFANYGYIEAIDTRFKAIHIQTHKFASVAHMNDIIGPMTNPIHPKKLTTKLVGVNQVIGPAVVGEAYLILNKKGITNVEQGLFVRGLLDPKKPNETMDEISLLKGGTEITLLRDRKIESFKTDHKAFGFSKPATLQEISPNSTSANDRIGYTLNVLRGKASESATNLLLANAGALIALSRGSQDFKDGTEVARTAFRGGEHWKVIEKVRKYIPTQPKVFVP